MPTFHLDEIKEYIIETYDANYLLIALDMEFEDLVELLEPHIRDQRVLFEDEMED